jgi:hypothetical protein
VGTELHLSRLPGDVIHVSGPRGEDGGVSCYCAAPRLCPDVPDRYVSGAPSTSCQSNGPFAQCRQDRTNRGCRILPASSDTGRPLPTG